VKNLNLLGTCTEIFMHMTSLLLRHV